MGQFGRITKVSDLPPKKVLTEYIKLAKKLNDDGREVADRVKKKTPRELVVPDDLAKALKRNKAAQADVRQVQSQQQTRICGLDHRGQDRGHPNPAARDGHRMDGRRQAAELEVHELLAAVHPDLAAMLARWLSF